MRSWIVSLALVACGSPQVVGSTPASDEPRVLDRDADGIPDAEDLCPCHREDVDHFEDQDGCPDRDNDQDRIVDACDMCPDDPEVYNGEEDLDGCPDHAMVRISSSRIVIMDHVYFVKNSARIRPQSEPLLDAIADVMRTHPEVELVEVQGHATPRERNREALAQERADNMREALIQRGVEPERLVARGYSDTRPIAPNTTADGRERNRRIDLMIQQMGEGPPAPPPPPPHDACPDGPPPPEPPVCDPDELSGPGGAGAPRSPA